MPRNKSISEQIIKMQKAGEQLKQWEKLFDKACQMRFGMSAKTIEKMLSENRISTDEFQHKKKAIDSALYTHKKEG